MARTVGQRAGLDRAAVVAAALDILRRDGLDAVSMRRVAEQLGVAPNSIYAHVADKDALVDELLDAVLGTVGDPGPGAWRDRIVTVMRDSRRALLAHPDLIPFALVRQTAGPNALRLGELTLAALHDAGVDGEVAVTGLQVLLVQTIGSAAFESGRLRDPDPEARRRRGRDLAAGSGGLTADLREPISRWDGETNFELGLGWLLDGLGAD